MAYTSSHTYQVGDIVRIITSGRYDGVTYEVGELFKILENSIFDGRATSPFSAKRVSDGKETLLCDNEIEPVTEAVHRQVVAARLACGFDKSAREEVRDNMQNGFKAGDVIRLQQDGDGDYLNCDCGNLRSAFEDGEVAAIRVLHVDGSRIDQYEPLDARGKLVDMDGSWSDKTKNCCRVYNNTGIFALVRPAQSFMGKVKILAAKMLDGDTKALIEAGYLDDCLELTEMGKQVALSHYLLANKKALADDARDAIAKEKAEKSK